MMTKASLPRARSCAIISSPSILGIFRSVMIRPGRHFSACSRPSSPLAACPTTTQSRLAQSIASTIPFRISSSSSTTKTFSIGSLLSLWAGKPQRRRQFRLPGFPDGGRSARRSACARWYQRSIAPGVPWAAPGGDRGPAAPAEGRSRCHRPEFPGAFHPFPGR